MNIVNVGYKSTNYYAIDIKEGRLLVDCGWPGTLPEFTASMKRKGISPQDIKYILPTHFHPDHAGLAQEFKDQGSKLIVLENQVGFIKPLAGLIKTNEVQYTPIREHDNLLLKFSEGRDFLAGLGLQGEIIPTPYHSEDSITLILDEGMAFTGDLPPLFMIPEDDEIGRKCWDDIHTRNVTKIFPGHGR
jgi:glyoxylase-like metal-dependent hydrolase (beta-lactamase superfamily II)